MTKVSQTSHNYEKTSNETSSFSNPQSNEYNLGQEFEEGTRLHHRILE